MTATASARLLGTPRYGVFWVTSLLSNIGSWMQSVAEPWLVLALGGSPFLVGLDAFANSAPFWILSLAGGLLADRHDKGRIIYFFQGLQMLCPLLIVALLSAGRIEIWMVIALSAVVGVTDALSLPAFQSLIPTIVRKSELGRALALNSLQFNLSRVLGPAVAGLVMMKYGALWCFSANAASYVPFFLSIYWLLPVLRKKVGASAPGKPVALTGIRTALCGSGASWALLSVFSTGLFCGPLVTFSPVIVKDLLHGDAAQFGGVLTAFGAGGVLAPALLLFLARRPRSMKASLATALLYAAVLPAVACAGSFTVLAGLLVAAGFLMTVANTSANTFLQFETADAGRGRMASFFMLALRGGLSLGNLATGMATGPLGIRGALAADGILGLLAQAFIAFMIYRSATSRVRP